MHNLVFVFERYGHQDPLGVVGSTLVILALTQKSVKVLSIGVVNKAHKHERVLAGTSLVGKLVAREGLIIAIDLVTLVHRQFLHLDNGVILGRGVSKGYLGAVLHDLLGTEALDQEER